MRKASLIKTRSETLKTKQINLAFCMQIISISFYPVYGGHAKLEITHCYLVFTTKVINKLSEV